MILVLDEGLDDAAVRAIERAVRAAGGDPKKLAEGGRLAIDARGADAVLLGRPAGVSLVLSPLPLYPKVRANGATRAVRVGPATFGEGFVVTAGPCAVESKEQVRACAEAVARAGGKLLRGGAFKPRSSPYSFQGMGEAALRILRDAADERGLGVVTEVMEPSLVPLVAEHADALQIGSRNMQNFALLKAVGRTRRPIFLKRGMSATLEEWLLAAEYVADAGNPDIVLCERGVRGFDPAARNLLDLAAVPLLRMRTCLPIVVDPSHGVGVREAIPAAARAAAAIGADGVMLEVHPDPGAALSDGFQALSLASLAPLVAQLARLSEAVRSTTTLASGARPDPAGGSSRVSSRRRAAADHVDETSALRERRPARAGALSAGGAPSEPHRRPPLRDVPTRSPPVATSSRRRRRPPTRWRPLRARTARR